MEEVVGLRDSPILALNIPPRKPAVASEFIEELKGLVEKLEND